MAGPAGQQAQGHLCLCFPRPGLNRAMVLCLAFHLSVRDLNLGPHACAALYQISCRLYSSLSLPDGVLPLPGAREVTLTSAACLRHLQVLLQTSFSSCQCLSSTSMQVGFYSPFQAVLQLSLQSQYLSSHPQASAWVLPGGSFGVVPGGLRRAGGYFSWLTKELKW